MSTVWQRTPSGLLVPKRAEPRDRAREPMGPRVTVYVHDTVGGGITCGGLWSRNLSVWDWTEGNWSCDCNRAGLFSGIGGPDDGACAGCRRYIVIDVLPMPDGYTLDDFNRDYPDDMKQLARQISAAGYEVKT